MSGTCGTSGRSEYRYPLGSLFEQRPPRGDHACGHPVGGEALGGGAAVDARVGRRQVRRQRRAPARPRSQSRQAEPSIPASATAWAPTGVPNAGTSHADASITASPMPSSCDGTITALAALIQYGTSSAGHAAEREQRRRRPPPPARGRSA